MRIAFTIIYDGVHHLKHLQFAERMAMMFDHWVVVEGHAKPFGSTKWCNRINTPASSIDGTIEFMNDFALDHKNVHFYSHGKYYLGKDEQVNIAIEIIKSITDKCFLWEVDVDEHWNLCDIVKAESKALKSDSKGFSFQFNHFVGKGLIAKGDWGSGWLNRLWKWSGEYFKSHEPALLYGQKVVEPIEGIKFDHYSYFFEKDVIFKSKYYKGHEVIYKNWKKIQKETSFPIHISELFGVRSALGKSQSYIYKINSYESN
jgi:hypothetical protein